MAFVNASELSSTDSDISMSDLKHPEFDRPVLPMSEYKYVEASTLPAIPWPESRKQLQFTSESLTDTMRRRPTISNESSLFPETPEYLAYMQARRGGLSNSGPRTKSGRRVNPKPDAQGAQGTKRGRKLNPKPDATMRRSERIAALNAMKTEQEGYRVAKRHQKSSPRTRQKMALPLRKRDSRRSRGKHPRYSGKLL